MIGVSLLTSCNTAPQPAPIAQPTTPPPPDPILLATDPCALRMQDIAAAMTVYLSKIQELPPALTLLKPSAARVGLTLNFSCPVSNLPYVYVPNGLTAPGDPHRLVLYDATPAHDGHYWAVMLLPAQATQPLTAEVNRLTPAMLQLYLKSADTPQPPLPMP